MLSVLLLLFHLLPELHAYTAYSVCDRFAGIRQCETPVPHGLLGVLRVGVAQTASTATDTLEQNAAKIAEWVKLAAAEGARVVLFPELAVTGYFAGAVVALAGPEGKASVANARIRQAEDLIASACKEHKIYAIYGTPVFWGDVNATSNPRPWYNTALVIGPDGTKLYRQAKLYPCCLQDGSAGEWIDIFNISNFDGSVIPVATQICFDDYHPEIVRLQAMQGAQILFYMSWESDVSREFKLSLSGLGSAQGVVSANAAVNQIFIVQANAGALVDNMITEQLPGYGGSIDGGCHGQSRIVDPQGSVLEEARVFGEQLLIHDLDLGLCSKQQDRMPMAGLSHKLFGPMWNEGMKTLGHRMPIDW